MANDDDDIRHDDLEYNIEAAEREEPKSSKAWLNLLRESEEAFASWHDRCDNLDRMYANIERLSQLERNREFQMFWANSEVIKPSIYAKPPVPVVVPKFKDRRPVYQQASEILERCCNVAFDLTNIDELMVLIRDDVAMVGRGVAWCRYEAKGEESRYDYEKVCIDYKGRRDFLHSISRNWREVSWVAAASYLTRPEARERFQPYSGDAYQEAEYRVDKDSKEIGGADDRERAKFWEVWHKGENRVVWVAEGVDVILDEDKPHLKLKNFFPCPRPAYGTLQRGSLVPVPDVMQYKDQLDEINLLTGRIHALTSDVTVKGFYPGGTPELSEAIQTAVGMNTPGQILVPIANFATFGNTKEVIIWMPIDMIVQTVTALVAMRKQVIEDIYQIMGLSDIMRGATDPNETLGAQQLKTQYGSTRIRDKQQEIIRIARDLVEITSEIITEKFSDKTIIAMSQTQVPTDKMVKQQAMELIDKLRQTQQKMQQPDPNMPPEQGQQAQGQAQAEMQQIVSELQALQDQPTIEQVLRFLNDNQAKAFVLDIETDSTIMADENAEKQRRTEFVQVLGTLLPQLSQMIQANPKTADFCGEILKFATAPFRSGRTLDGAIDELVEQVKVKGDQPQPDDPVTAKGKLDMQIEQMKLEATKARDQAEMQLKQAELQMKDAHKQAELQNERAIKMAEMQAKQGDRQAEMVQANQEQMHDREVHQMEMIKKQSEVGLQAQKADMMMRQHQMKSSDMAQRANERRQQQAFKQQNTPPPGNRGI